MCNKAWQSRGLAHGSSQSMKLILTLWNGILICHSGTLQSPNTHSGSILGLVCMACNWVTARRMLGAFPTLWLWTRSGHVWTVSQKWSLNLAWLRQHTPRGLASEWGLLLSVLIYQHVVNTKRSQWNNSCAHCKFASLKKEKGLQVRSMIMTKTFHRFLTKESPWQ